MGPFLILSLAVGGQVGAKRGKLTPLRGLKGTKLELKGALGAHKEAPRGRKGAMRRIDGTARGVIFGPGGPP